MPVGASRALGSDKLVDAGAQVVQLEVLLGRGLAVVDLLRPLLERHLDAERLVDREGDVEEVQAVDAEIVDGVTLRLDRVARDVAGLGDDTGHGLEGRRHHKSLIGHAFPWTALACLRLRDGSPSARPIFPPKVSCPYSEERA